MKNEKSTFNHRMLYFTLNQSHGEICKKFDRADFKIIRIKLFIY
jgi:hypothetical protein